MGDESFFLNGRGSDVMCNANRVPFLFFFIYFRPFFYFVLFIILGSDEIMFV